MSDKAFVMEIPEDLLKRAQAVHVDVRRVVIDALEQEVQRVQQTNETWDLEELAELLKPHPMSGPEIVERGLYGGWEHLNIEDSASWVRELRQKLENENKQYPIPTQP